MKSSKILIMSVLIILSSFSNEISAQTTESTVKNDTIAFVFKKTSDDLKNNIAKLKDAGKKSKKSIFAIFYGRYGRLPLCRI